MTSPLPRVRSTNWAIRAWKTNCLMLIFAEALSRIKPFESQWTVKDSNLRKLLLSDLQSDPVGHLGNRPLFYWSCCQLLSAFKLFLAALTGLQLSRQWGSNPWPAAYKAAALPTELCRRISGSLTAHHCNRNSAIQQGIHQIFRFCARNICLSLSQERIIHQTKINATKNTKFVISNFPVIFIPPHLVKHSKLCFNRDK